VTPRAGSVTFRGHDSRTFRRIGASAAASRSYRRAGACSAYVVEENLAMGGYPLGRAACMADGLERCFAMFPILAERRWQAPARSRAASSRCSRSPWA